MNIQEYISSGIIESYVMGMASKKEREEFEQLCKLHPELEEARRQFELSLEQKSIDDAIEPPPGIKERFMDAIKNEKASTLATIIELPTTPNKKTRSTSLYWTVAACIILLAGCLGLIWFFYQKNSQLEAEMASVEKANDSLGRKSQDLETQLLRDGMQVKKVEFKNPEANSPADINVFWDSASTHVYLVIKNLGPLPTDQRYHLWAVTKGKRQSLGLFDAPKEDKLILKMNNVQEADSFTISIEKRIQAVPSELVPQN